MNKYTVIPWLFVCTIACNLINQSKAITVQDENTTLSYEEFVQELQNVEQNLYAGYPEKDNLIGQFPPPKGSRIVRNNHTHFEKVRTMETDVEILIMVLYMESLNVEHQSLTIIANEHLEWEDQFFAKQEHANVYESQSHHIEVQADHIWTPAILPGNVMKKSTLFDHKTVSVTSKGKCTTEKLISYTIPCSVNVQTFPFDNHNCTLRLTQQDSFNKKMKFIRVFDEEFKETLQENAMGYVVQDHDRQLEWDVVDFCIDIEKNKNSEAFDKDEFVMKLVLQRRAAFYATVLIFPCVLLNILSLVIFTLPLTDTGRENFALTLILTYFVLIMIVVDSSPPTGNEMPLLGLYILLSTGVVVITFVMSLILIEINEHFREKKRKMPIFLARMLDNRCIVWAFTSSYHFNSHNVNDNSENTEEEEEKDATLLKNEPSKNKKSPITVSKAANHYKWKIFCKVLNFIFFLICLIAHIVIALAMYLTVVAYTYRPSFSSSD